MITHVFMNKGYKQLTVGERDLIGALKAAGKSIGDIGREVGRDKSTISRELRRNGPPIHNRYYLSHRAHERSVEMRIRTHTRARLKSEEIKGYVSSKLMLEWSPELIAGRLKDEHPELRISYEAIYQWIYNEAKEYIIVLWVRSRNRRSVAYWLYAER